MRHAARTAAGLRFPGMTGGRDPAGAPASDSDIGAILANPARGFDLCPRRARECAT